MPVHLNTLHPPYLVSSPTRPLRAITALNLLLNYDPPFITPYLHDPRRALDITPETHISMPYYRHLIRYIDDLLVVIYEAAAPLHPDDRLVNPMSPTSNGLLQIPTNSAPSAATWVLRIPPSRVVRIYALAVLASPAQIQVLPSTYEPLPILPASPTPPSPPSEPERE